MVEKLLLYHPVLPFADQLKLEEEKKKSSMKKIERNARI